MNRRKSFTDQRRRQLALQVASLERCEDRAMITESLGLMLLGPAVSLLREATLRASWESGAIRLPKTVANAATTIARPPIPSRRLRRKRRRLKNKRRSHRAPPLFSTSRSCRRSPKRDAGDWLTMRPKPLDALTAQAAQPWTPASSFGGGGGGALPGAGGFASTNQGQITPLRVPPPSNAANSLPNVAFAAPSSTSSGGSTSGGLIAAASSSTSSPSTATTDRDDQSRAARRAGFKRRLVRRHEATRSATPPACSASRARTTTCLWELSPISRCIPWTTTTARSSSPASSSSPPSAATSISAPKPAARRWRPPGRSVGTRRTSPARAASAARAPTTSSSNGPAARELPRLTRRR